MAISKPESLSSDVFGSMYFAPVGLWIYERDAESPFTIGEIARDLRRANNIVRVPIERLERIPAVEVMDTERMLTEPKPYKKINQEFWDCFGPAFKFVVAQNFDNIK
jgi:hypothetical protein